MLIKKTELAICPVWKRSNDEAVVFEIHVADLKEGQLVIGGNEFGVFLSIS